MKRELKNQWLLVCTVIMGVLLFSFKYTQAQETERYRTDTNTSIESTRTDESDDDDNMRQSTRSDYDMAAPKVGIKGGVNFSNLITDGEVTDEKILTGFHAGIFGQLFSSEAFAIQPEVNYSTRGNKVEHEFGIIDAETKFRLNYIDIPVLAVFKLGQVAEIHAGAYWAYLVGANIDTDGDLGDDFRSLDRDNFENWDYGLVGGLGFNLGNSLQIGGRYNYGLNDIADSRGARRLLGDTKNSLAQIYLAFNLASGNSMRNTGGGY